MTEPSAKARLAFAQNFKSARCALGLTQRGFADQHGVGQRIVSAVETGGHNMTIKSLARFAEMVGRDLPAMLTSQE